MKITATVLLTVLLSLSSSLMIQAAESPRPQKGKSAPPPQVEKLLTRTTARHEIRRFAYGGTVTIVGAPQGSLSIEGWSRNEVDIEAEIILHAATESDLDQLAAVNTFVLDEDLNHLSLLATGTHDRVFMKKVAKDFPKRLLGLPWEINYRIHVPLVTDLDLNAGDGAVKLSGVEGAIRFNGRRTDADLVLIGGTVSITIAVGEVRVSLPSRNWRGAGLEVQLAGGNLNVELPGGFSGDIDADVLRTGTIENGYDGFAPREKPGITSRAIRARAGNGGATLRFAVVEGTIKFKKRSNE